MTSHSRASLAAALPLLLVAGLLHSPSADAALIVDTGEHAATAPSLSAAGARRAGLFSIGAPTKITGVQLFMAGATAGQMTFVLYADGSGLPGTELYSAAFDVSFCSEVAACFEWQGASSLAWIVGPGTYWASLETRSGQSGNTLVKFASVASGLAPPSPLASEAAWNEPSGPWTATLARRGWRIFGEPYAAPVPEPGTLALLGLSLAGLALVRRRRAD